MTRNATGYPVKRAQTPPEARSYLGRWSGRPGQTTHQEQAWPLAGVINRQPRISRPKWNPTRVPWENKEWRET